MDALDTEVADALAAIEAEWPCWHAWLGVNGILYARRPRTSPPAVVRGKNTTCLRIAIAVKQYQLDKRFHRI